MFRVITLLVGARVITDTNIFLLEKYQLNQWRGEDSIPLYHSTDTDITAHWLL